MPKPPPLKIITKNFLLGSKTSAWEIIMEGKRKKNLNGIRELQPIGR